MNCPEYGTCHDPEWCQQGGPCDSAHEPWPPALLASVATSGLSLGIGVVGVLTTWSLAPLWVTVAGFGVAVLLAASMIPWREAWQEMRERRRIETAAKAIATAEIVAEEARR